MSTTAKTGFTPGPWELSQQQGLRLFIVGDDEAIAEVLPADFSEITFANGNLIAAAPSLLAELEHAHDMIRHYLKCGYLPHMSAEEAEQLVRNPDSAVRKARRGQ